MSVTNLYDLDKTPELPSPQFLFRQNQSALDRLSKDILLKESQFKLCSFPYDIQKKIYEKELGELYAEFMGIYKKSIHTSGL